MFRGGDGGSGGREEQPCTPEGIDENNNEGQRQLECKELLNNRHTRTLEHSNSLKIEGSKVGSRRILIDVR